MHTAKRLGSLIKSIGSPLTNNQADNLHTKSNRFSSEYLFLPYLRGVSNCLCAIGLGWSGFLNKTIGLAWHPRLSVYGMHGEASVGEKSRLFVVATPIGNILDASPRLVETLQGVDMVACEDTRVSGKLFERLGIQPKKLVSYHDFNETARAASLVASMLEEKLDIALVSDAGSPCIADPGFRLVDQAHKAGIRVIPVCGPSAAVTLAMASGLPTDRFTFIGFLPHKISARKSEICSWNENCGSVLFFETATRIEDTLKIISTTWPNSKVVIGRELTKKYEEIVRFEIENSLNWIELKKEKLSLKGEFVLMCHGFEQNISRDDLIRKAKTAIKKGLQSGKSHKSLLKELSTLDVDRTTLYNLILELKKSNSNKSD